MTGLAIGLFCGFIIGNCLCSLTETAKWKKKFDQAMDGWEEALRLLKQINTAKAGNEGEG